MGDRIDKILGGLIAIASASIGAAAVAYHPAPQWMPVVLAGLGAAGGLIKVGWLGTGGDND